MDLLLRLAHHLMNSHFIAMTPDRLEKGSGEQGISNSGVGAFPCSFAGAGCVSCDEVHTSRI
jgi:hypothetical protein